MSADIIYWLKKLVGKYEQAMGIRIYGLDSSQQPVPVRVDDVGRLIVVVQQSAPDYFKDHLFNPEVEVTDTMKAIDVNAHVISVASKEGDIKVNFGRPVTATEYYLLSKGLGLLVARYTDKIYAQARAGQTGKLRITALKI